MSTARHPHAHSEDIDLLIIAERALIFFSKYKWLFIISLVLGMGLGFLFYSRLPKVYKSRMILQSNFISNSDYIEIINNWDDLRRHGEYAALAEAFHCPVGLANDIKQIKGNEIQKVFTPNNPNGFYITVYASKNTAMEHIQDAIIYGLENTDYVRQKIEVKKANLNDLINKTSAEINKLDSTKKIIEDMMEGKSRSSSSLMVDASNIYKQSIELNAMLLGYQEELKFTHAVQVLQGFSLFNKPAGPHLMVWLAIGIVFSLFVASSIALIHSIREKLKARAPAIHRK